MNKNGKNTNNIGSSLKIFRKDYGISIRKLAEEIGYSHSYISSVETGAKQQPSDEFIKSYILGVTNNDKRKANLIIDTLVQVYGLKLEFFESDNLEDNPIIDEFLNSHIFVSAGKRTAMNEKKQELQKNIFTEPINDLWFHLNDDYNVKYYKDYLLTESDVKNIKRLIDTYLEINISTKLDDVNQSYNVDLDDREKQLLEDLDKVMSDDV